MARGTALSTLRAMLKSEIGYSQDTNLIQDIELNLLLANEQKRLGPLFQWPFLRDRWDVTVGPAQRYLPLPTVSSSTGATVAIDFEMSDVLVEVKYNTTWQVVDYGIGSEQYNYLDSDVPSNILDPIQRWRFNTNVDEAGATQNQFEVWPLPATGQQLRFSGYRVLNPLFDGSDITAYKANQVTIDARQADLDDLLIVLFVAAAKLQRLEQADAKVKLAEAQQRFVRVTANYETREDKIVLGRNLMQQPGRAFRAVPLVLTK